jgi:hypothetical protein
MGRCPNRLLLWALLTGALGGCGRASQTAPGRTGLLRGACQEQWVSGVDGAASGPLTPCPGVTVTVQDTDGRPVATAATDGNGEFQVRLRPGRYRVSAGGRFHDGPPREGEIRPGGLAEAEFASIVAFPSPAGGRAPDGPHGAGQKGERPPRP